MQNIAPSDPELVQAEPSREDLIPAERRLGEKSKCWPRFAETRRAEPRLVQMVPEAYTK